MTEQFNEGDEFASGDLNPDLASIWDETDDDGILLPENSAEDVPEVDDDESDVDNEDTLDGEDGELGDDDDDGSSDDDNENNDDGEDEEGDEVDYKALFEKAQNDAKAMAGRLKAMETPQPKPTNPSTEVKSQSPFTEEEQALIDNFRNTYSDEVVKVIDLLTRHQASQIVGSTLQDRLTPIEQTTQEIVAQAHFAAIESVHPDLQEIDASPIFDSWIESRPAHLVDTYKNIRDRGTPAQVISMLAEFKKDSGYGKKSEKQGSAKAKKHSPTTAVKRRRGTVSVAPKLESTDLAALWDEFDE